MRLNNLNFRPASVACHKLVRTLVLADVQRTTESVRIHDALVLLLLPACLLSRRALHDKHQGLVRGAGVH